MTATLHETPATPAGVLVYNGPPHTDAWFTARLGGITATDCVAILGLSDYENARSVWARKRGILTSDDAGEAAHWGTVLEDPIAQEWARRNRSTVEEVGVLANATDMWQRASLDRLVMSCPDDDGPCLLEVKNKSEWQAGKWRDNLPDDVHAQVAWQMLVTGYRHAHVAALVGGNRLVQHRVDHDPDVEAWLVEACAAVWAAVTDPDAPPPDITYDSLARDVIERIHPDREGVTRIPLAQALAVMAEYQDAARELTEANAAVKTAKARKEGAEALLLDVMGAGDMLTVDDADVPLVTAKTVEVPARIQAGYSYRRVFTPKAGRIDLELRKSAPTTAPLATTATEPATNGADK